ncbi:MAG TPA: hypothetical protein EYP04_12065 [Anaerolineae bacterium]|nr:hypothetical protein [Anaerolineae bacterium]
MNQEPMEEPIEEMEAAAEASEAKAAGSQSEPETPAVEPEAAQGEAEIEIEELSTEAEAMGEITDDDKLMAALSYAVPVLVSAIILLSETAKKRPFQRYHAIQSLGLAGAVTVTVVAGGLAVTILQVVPVLGMLFGLVALFCVAPLGLLVVIGLFLYYAYRAYQGEQFTVPGLTSFMQDQGWF